MSQANRLLEALRDGQWHSNFDLIREVYAVGGPASARLAARINDLKRRGYQIEGRHDKEDKRRYWYRWVDPMEPFVEKNIAPIQGALAV